MRATSKARKAALLLFSVAVLLAGGATAVRGQSALDGFDPNASNTVQVVVVQPDGKILIGGFFTAVLGEQRNYIARLNPDGTLDTAFDPNADGRVESIAVQADGKILVGGFFSTIGGQTRNRIARLDAVTGQADSFDPNADFAVESIVVQGDGKILAGGGFTTIGGQTRNHIARLDAVTGLADSFNPNSDDSIYAIAVQTDGKILVGGIFTSIGGQTRVGIARLDATTGLADSFDPNANNTVRSLAVQADGKILVGGEFSGANSIGGQTRNRIARLDPCDRPGRFVQPEREQHDQHNCRAGGREDFSGRQFLWSEQHRRTATQQNCPAGCHNGIGRFVRSEREHSFCLFQSRCRRMARFWRAAVSPRSRRTGDRR